jgi:hypothetical protein
MVFIPDPNHEWWTDDEPNKETIEDVVEKNKDLLKRLSKR